MTWSSYGIHTRKRTWKNWRKCPEEATKVIQGYQDLSYEERLKRCELTTLVKSRSRGDLIEGYKIITGKESIQWERFFELVPSKGK